jgi:hypothetical protein
MSDTKRKIDLKARLGKKTVKGGPGQSVPPPVGIPKPVGIPVPPFGAQQKKKAPPPKVDASDPYAAISAEHAPERDEPQTLKVEMSEEVVAAQKKGRAKVIVLAFVTAAVGGFLGYTLGGRTEANKGAMAAVQGAADLKEKVEEANGAVMELANTLKTIKEKFGKKEYPEAEIKKLGEIYIPFESHELYGRGIGRFNKETQMTLIKFTAGVQAANTQKERVHLELGRKKQVTEFLKQGKTPKVQWAVYPVQGPHGPWAVMHKLDKKFLTTSKEKKKDEKGKEKGYEWPEEFEIKDGGRKHKLKRFTRGDPTDGPKVIPVDPTSESDVCPSDLLRKLGQEAGTLELTLRGDPTPGREKQGLFELGEILVEQLGKIGKAGG